MKNKHWSSRKHTVRNRAEHSYAGKNTSTGHI
jgi:hypothetical protein